MTTPEKTTPNSGNGIYIRGAVIGAILGMISVFLYQRAVDEDDSSDGSLSVKDMMQLGLILIGVVRQIAELGSKSGKD